MPPSSSPSFPKSLSSPSQAEMARREAGRGLEGAARALQGAKALQEVAMAFQGVARAFQGVAARNRHMRGTINAKPAQRTSAQSKVRIRASVSQVCTSGVAGGLCQGSAGGVSCGVSAGGVP